MKYASTLEYSYASISVSVKSYYRKFVLDLTKIEVVLLSLGQMPFSCLAKN
jgi:hypothetical protein